MKHLQTDVIDLFYQHRVDPIPGTTKPAHLQENLWSSDFEFTPRKLKEFTDTIAKIQIIGDRYPTPQTK